MTLNDLELARLEHENMEWAQELMTLKLLEGGIAEGESERILGAPQHLLVHGPRLPTFDREQ